jgi:hypothetical protein
VDSMSSWMKTLKLDVTEDQYIAAQFCESRGLRFLVEFGYDNAIPIADRIFDEECDRVMIQ